MAMRILASNSARKATKASFQVSKFKLKVPGAGGGLSGGAIWFDSKLNGVQFRYGEVEVVKNRVFRQITVY